MNNQLFLPKKINVGYQQRSDTYTKMLAYIIYFDNKNVLRKETSWNGWRDQKIPNTIYDNVPTEGFVLNKKAGGYSSGWDHRQTYCRVWDPRGFEFEITIPNLLFILQETSSLKGKGLEGEFVYAWEGKDLVLLPACSQEYKSSSAFTELQGKKVAAKDMIEGATYQTKKQEKLIFLGKFTYVDKEYEWNDSVSISKKYVFVDKDGKYIGLDGVASLAVALDETPVTNYADLIEAFSESDNGKIKEIIPTAAAINTAEEFYYYNRRGSAESGYEMGTYYKQESPNVYRAYSLIADVVEAKRDSWGYSRYYRASAYKIKPIKELTLVDGELKTRTLSGQKVSAPIGVHEINKSGMLLLNVRVKSGKKYKLN